ncbi:hypothetical protein DAD186_08370 [Dermabacter vaginalis]|uniref:Uncharacterized protein n=1 Tax=Dermabacter vaginalis TaxID=1630135 RepID=A0A1B0ZHJ6_9MICO|nr:hypothetical protein DAD186_08370 [Dermabacter vaginalis]
MQPRIKAYVPISCIGILTLVHGATLAYLLRAGRAHETPGKPEVNVQVLSLNCTRHPQCTLVPRTNIHVKGGRSWPRRSRTHMIRLTA